MAAPTVTICGAGIAGIALAHELAARRGVRDVLLVDERPPLQLTSDKSAECYRNWWPGRDGAMTALMNRSIDLLEELAGESGDAFALGRRGYVYLTARPEQAAALEHGAREISGLGGGPLRVHRGAADDPPYPEGERWDDPALAGADLVLDPALVRRRLPFVAPDAVAMLHARRCGWLSAQQLGMLLLERARERGVELRRARLVGVEVAAGRVEAVRLQADGGDVERLATGGLVLAAGPLLPAAAALLGVELPVYNELHAKVSFVDHLGILPRDAPLTIWADPIAPAWSAEERAGLAEEPGGRRLLGELPAGAHFRPEGGAASPVALMLWTYDVEPRQPVWPPAFDPLHPHVVLRGLQRMVPALAAYGERMRAPYVDGGYYCKTRENRPLLGPLPIAGAHVLGALSGYGIMASQAAAELVADHLTGAPPPPYAAAFLPARYDDPAYVARLPELAAASGQL